MPAKDQGSLKDDDKSIRTVAASDFMEDGMTDQASFCSLGIRAPDERSSFLDSIGF